MKNILTLMTLLLLFQTKCFSLNDTTAYPVEIKIKIDTEYLATHDKAYYDIIYRDGQYDLTSDSAKEKRYDINVTIKNNSSSAIYIWLMTCSWSDNFLVNNNYIFMEGQNCDHNFPEIVEFEPGESKVYRTTLIKSIKFDYPLKFTVYGTQVETTKLGLIIISDIFRRNAINILDYKMLMQDKSKWTTVWSNSLHLLDRQLTQKRL